MRNKYVSWAMDGGFDFHLQLALAYSNISDIPVGEILKGR